MTFGTSLVAFGAAGAFLILGAIVRTFWFSNHGLSLLIGRRSTVDEE